VIPILIKGATRYLGAPAGWNPEKDGPCEHLAIVDFPPIETGGSPTMVSAWEPTPVELARLNAGGKVYLSIVGTGHPPVWLWVPE
jgi:hypothetical protein